MEDDVIDVALDVALDAEWHLVANYCVLVSRENRSNNIDTYLDGLDPVSRQRAEDNLNNVKAARQRRNASGI